MSGFDPRRWSREDFETAIGALADSLGKVSDAPEKQLQVCLELLLNVENLQQPAKHFNAIVHAFHALALHERVGGLSDSQIDRIVEMVESLLRVNGIRPAEGVTSFYYTLLYQSLARIRTAAGRQWDGLFSFYRSQTAGKRARNDTASDVDLVAASHALACGSATLAWHHLKFAAEDAQGHQEAENKLWLMRATLHRLAGETEDAKELLDKLAAREQLPTNLRCHWAWETLWRDCLLEKSARLASRRTKPDRAPDLYGYAIDLWLWGRGLPTADGPMVLPTLRACKDRVNKSALPLDRALFAAAQLIEECHDGERPFEKRLAIASEALAEGRLATTIERRLLIIAAVVRWLFRSNQFALAAAALGSYNGLSLQASRNRRKDALGILDDLEVERLLDRHSQVKRPQVERVASKVDASSTMGLANLAALSRVFAEASALALKGRVRRWITRSEEARRLVEIDNEAAISRVVAGYLRKRRGVLLKLGQICSYLDGPFGAHVAQEFEVLQSDVEPMGYETVAGIMTAEFGHGPEVLFREFERTPFASGSLGQVHRARLHTGALVAVKIQYPDIEAIIEIDLKRAGWVLPHFKKLLPGTDMNALLEEAKAMLKQETDYRAEAESMREFRAMFAHDPFVKVPEVYGELSNGKVLTMEYVGGATFSQFAEAASQAERDHAGEVIFRVFAHSSILRGKFNGDPHPGNFLFKDSQVVLLDFGCVKQLPESVLGHRNGMFRAFYEGDHGAFVRHYVGCGFAKSTDGLDVNKMLKDFGVLVSHTLEDKPFQFTEDHPTKVFRTYTAETKGGAEFLFPRDFLFLIRFDFGVWSLLSRLGARFNARAISVPYFFADVAASDQIGRGIDQAS